MCQRELEEPKRFFEIAFGTCEKSLFSSYPPCAKGKLEEPKRFFEFAFAEKIFKFHEDFSKNLENFEQTEHSQKSSKIDPLEENGRVEIKRDPNRTLAPPPCLKYP